jgi:hypothetical protein
MTCRDSSGAYATVARPWTSNSASRVRKNPDESTMMKICYVDFTAVRSALGGNSNPACV